MKDKQTNSEICEDSGNNVVCNRTPDLSCDDMIDKVAKSILKKHYAAFKILASGEFDKSDEIDI